MNDDADMSRSIFLVEDEVMIRMMVADMLDDLGHRVVAEAGDVTTAVVMAETADFDLAILDVNVAGTIVSPVADVVRARGRPIIFATGYGPLGLPEQYRAFPTLQKPFAVEMLAATIAQLPTLAPEERSNEPR